MKAASGLNLLIWVSLLACMIPWFMIQSHQALNTDLAWLTIAAGRLLDGESMAQAYYDPNPPLSVLVQIVPALTARLLPVPLYDAVFFYSLALVLLSTLTVAALLRRMAVLTKPETQVLLIAYTLANTLFTGQYLGERDHYIVLGLFPFVLVQAAITFGLTLPVRLKWGVLLAGAAAVLIKPHYGLIPVALLIHRMVYRRRLGLIRDADFQALAIATLSYALIMLFFFTDYLTIILPDSLTFYVVQREAWVMRIVVSLGLFIACLAVAAPLLAGERGKLSGGLFWFAFLCLVPFAVQGKGFFYHMIPSMVFLLCGLSLLVFQTLKSISGRYAFCLPFLILAMLMTLCYQVLPPNGRYMTHTEYRQSELAQIIAACGQPCPFFIFNDMLEIVHPLDVYSGQIFASRFPSYWFLSSLAAAEFAIRHGQSSLLPEDRLTAAKRKYAAMVGEDFQRYQPKLVLIGQFKINGAGPEFFDFPAYFSVDPVFRAEWNNYHFIRDLTIDRSRYFGGTLLGTKRDDVIYKIYEKRNDKFSIYHSNSRV